jgi:hypothetical protein
VRLWRLRAGEVHAHELAGLEHDSYTKIVPPRVVNCKAFRMIAKRAAVRLDWRQDAVVEVLQASLSDAFRMTN